MGWLGQATLETLCVGRRVHIDNALSALCDQIMDASEISESRRKGKIRTKGNCQCVRARGGGSEGERKWGTYKNASVEFENASVYFGFW